jgi:hypothetical protein
MAEYVRYYHEDRTHPGLAKDTPTGRPTAMCPLVGSKIHSHSRLGGPASSLRRSGIDSDNSINRDRLSLPPSEPGWRAFRRGPSPWIGVTSGWSNESRINRLTHQAEEKFLSVRDVLTNHNVALERRNWRNSKTFPCASSNSSVNWRFITSFTCKRRGAFAVQTGFLVRLRFAVAQFQN